MEEWTRTQLSFCKSNAEMQILPMCYQVCDFTSEIFRPVSLHDRALIFLQKTAHGGINLDSIVV